MSQSGYTPIITYNSGTTTNVPLAANLASGELAINYADGKLFYKDSGGVVQTIASKSGNVNVSSFSGGTTGLTPNTATTGAITLSGTLSALNGGTGQSSAFTQYGVTYAASTSALTVTAAGTTGQVLTGVTGGAPIWATPTAQTYPGAGIANSTGSAWGTSYSTTGSGTVVALATSPSFTTPVLGTPTSGNLSNCTADGTNGVGFLNIPQNSQSAAYTTVLADSGKCIYHPSTDANARTFTIAANSSVAYAIGTVIQFVNMTSQVVTIAINTDTLYLAGTGTTGSRSLAQYGVANAMKMTSTTWIITGSGLT